MLNPSINFTFIHLSLRKLVLFSRATVTNWWSERLATAKISHWRSICCGKLEKRDGFLLPSHMFNIQECLRDYNTAGFLSTDAQCLFIEHDTLVYSFPPTAGSSVLPMPKPPPTFWHNWSLLSPQPHLAWGKINTKNLANYLNKTFKISAFTPLLALGVSSLRKDIPLAAGFCNGWCLSELK